MSVEIIIPRRGINDEGKGKKYALHKLISASNADILWLRDDDIEPPSASLEQAEHIMQGYDMMILPLRMESPQSHPSISEKLQIAEYAAIWQLTIQSALQDRPTMCSGANLLVRRSQWLQSWPHIHADIPSGDDMFLLEDFKRRHLRIGITTSTAFEAVVRPQGTLCSLLAQRMRWAGKAPNYTDPDIRHMGIIVVVSNLLQLVCPPIILIKFPIEYRLIKKRDPQVSLSIAILLEVLYPVYMIVCLIGGLFRRSW